MKMKVKMNMKMIVEQEVLDSPLTAKLLTENEYKINSRVALGLFAIIGINIILICAGYYGLFHFFGFPQKLSLFFSSGLLLVAATISLIFKNKRKWIKYLLVYSMCLSISLLCSSFQPYYSIALVLPIIMASAYSSKKFTIEVIAIVSVLTLTFTVLNFFTYNILDLNTVIPKKDTLIIIGFDQDPYKQFVKDADIVESFFSFVCYVLFPQIIIMIITSILSISIAKHGRNNLLKQAKELNRNSKITSELEFASDIQQQFLPNTFSDLPKEVEVTGLMKAAKEVGGDFYDVYMVDDKHLVFVIADVSGKGVPAAMFMVLAKTIIKDNAKHLDDPALIFEKVNESLCENNKYDFFVTAWLGILDITTGELSFVNAGHNPPIFINKNECEYNKFKSGFFLAGADHATYKLGKCKLSPKDKIVLYTDGVTEARDNEDNMYTDKHLLEFVNEHKKESVNELLASIDNDVNVFTKDVEQFDDITLLIIEYKKAQKDSKK